jgi:hypothetical protein
VAIRIELEDGSAFVLQASMDEWDAAFRRAAKKNAMIEIELPDHSIRTIDPREVQAFREEPEAEAHLEDQFRAHLTPAG